MCAYLTLFMGIQGECGYLTQDRTFPTIPYGIAVTRNTNKKKQLSV